MRYLILISIFTINMSLQAAEDSLEHTNNNLNQHSWGIAYGMGDFANNVSGDDDGEVNLRAFFFEYRYNQYYSLHTKLYNATEPGTSFDGGPTTIGLQFSFKAKTAIWENLGGYARGGVNLSATKFDSGASEGGAGFVAATGLEYISDQGFIVGFEFEYFTGGGIDVTGINFSIGRSF